METLGYQRLISTPRGPFEENVSSIAQVKTIDLRPITRIPAWAYILKRTRKKDTDLVLYTCRKIIHNCMIEIGLPIVKAAHVKRDVAFFKKFEGRIWSTYDISHDNMSSVLELLHADQLPSQPQCMVRDVQQALAGRATIDRKWWEALVTIRAIVATRE